MQLFSIGLYELNNDGTLKLDGSGNPVLSYENSDIQNFARAWTGFARQYERANYEIEWWDGDNRMDVMQVKGETNMWALPLMLRHRSPYLTYFSS